MLLLLFSIGEEKYGIEATQVIEVWPALPLKPIHRTPDYIAGFARCRKQLVPIVDISKLYINKSASSRISTRIILTKVNGANDKGHTIGIIAERVTDTVNIDGAAPAASIGIKLKSGSLTGHELLINGQLIHKINVDELLPGDLYDQLFCRNK